jgi:hypothetical protein
MIVAVSTTAHDAWTRSLQVWQGVGRLTTREEVAQVGALKPAGEHKSLEVLLHHLLRLGALFKALELSDDFFGAVHLV